MCVIFLIADEYHTLIQTADQLKGAKPVESVVFQVVSLFFNPDNLCIALIGLKGGPNQGMGKKEVDWRTRMKGSARSLNEVTLTADWAL